MGERQKKHVVVKGREKKSRPLRLSGLLGSSDLDARNCLRVLKQKWLPLRVQNTDLEL